MGEDAEPGLRFTRAAGEPCKLTGGVAPGYPSAKVSKSRSSALARHCVPWHPREGRHGTGTSPEVPPILSLLTLSFLLFTSFAALGAAGDVAGPRPGGREEAKEEEKPKEPPLKYSAWCAFRDLSDTRLPPKEDPTRDYTRAIAERWSGFARRGQWASIILELKNTTEKSEFKGTATIRFDPVKENERGVIPYQTYYRQEFEVGPQTTKQYGFSVLCPEDGWNQAAPVSISAKGISYDVRYVQLHDLDAGGEDFVVVVSESSGSFRHLATRARSPEDQSQQHERRVAVVEPQELPARWHDLTLANLIVIDGPPREQLTDSQWAALRSYVQAGGHLLITAGKDPSRLKGPVEELAGITVRGMMEVAALDSGEREDLNWAPKDPSWKLPMLDISVSPKGSPVVWYSQAARKVERCRRFYGLGSVTFLPYSLSDPRLENWPGRTLIPVEILDYGRGRRLFLNTTADDELTSAPQPINFGQRFGSGPARANPYQPQSLMNLRHNLDEAFSSHTEVQAQPKSTVVAFLLLYLLCAVPGNYLLFGWMRRREIAWLAVPVWAATFSVIAYVVGYMGQTGRLTVSEVAVIEAGPGQETGVARTFVGMYAPHRDEYRLEFPLVKAGADVTYDPQAAPGHLINIARTQERGIDIPPLYLVEDVEALSVERFLVQQRSTRQLELVHRVRIGGGLGVTVRSGKGNQNTLDIELQNNTGFTLYWPVYVYEGKAYALGATPDNFLEPGAGNKLSGLAISSGIDPNQAFFGRMVALPSAHGALARNCGTALNEYLRNQTGKFPQGVICAWLDNEKGVLPVKVGAGGREAKEPKSEGLSLLLVPVTIKREVPSGRPDFRISYSTNYNAATNEGSWNLVQRPVQLQNAPAPQPNPRSQNVLLVAYLKVMLPPNHRAYSYNGRQLHLQFKLGPEKEQKKSAPPLNGNMQVSARLHGANEWKDCCDQIITKDTDKNVLAPLPWGDFRYVSPDNAMIVRVLLTVNSAQQQGLRLEEVKCKEGRAGER